MSETKAATIERGNARKSTNGKGSVGFSEAERAAARERVKELKAAARPDQMDGEKDVRAKIAEMQGSDRAMAERIHALVKSSAPRLSPRTYYGMPAYALDGNVVCWFKPAQKFKSRYATFEFGDKAKLDDGDMWAVSFALKRLTAVEESRIAALVKKAVSSS